MPPVTFGLKSIRKSFIDSFFDHSLYIVEFIRSVVELTALSNGELNASPCIESKLASLFSDFEHEFSAADEKLIADRVGSSFLVMFQNWNPLPPSLHGMDHM